MSLKRGTCLKRRLPVIFFIFFLLLETPFWVRETAIRDILNMDAPILDSGKRAVKDFAHKYLGSFNGGYPSVSAVLVNSPGEVEQIQQNVARQELVAKILTTLIGLGISFTLSYFGIKWLANALDPTKQEKKESQQKAESLMKKIGVTGVKLSEYELCIAANLVDPLSMTVSWKDIGGLEDVIQEIRETVILPFRKHELFERSSLLQPPKGVLLYGPPGCGKTMIAKATAKAAGARFINLQVSSLVDKWYGESQKRAEAVFSLAVKLQPTIIFIDEIDSFLRSRNYSDHESTAMIKTQFMSFWDGLMTDPTCRVMIMGATNRPQDVDPAILRRMPSMFQIGLPNALQRKRILELILEKEQVASDIRLDHVADQTEGLSGSDLRELCRNAAIYRVRDYMKAMNQEDEEFVDASDSLPEDTETVSLRLMNMADFEKALEKIRQSKYKPNDIAAQLTLD